MQNTPSKTCSINNASFMAVRERLPKRGRVYKEFRDGRNVAAAALRQGILYLLKITNN